MGDVKAMNYLHHRIWNVTIANIGRDDLWLVEIQNKNGQKLSIPIKYGSISYPK